MSSSRNILTFEGCSYLRQHLVLSILSGKAIKIKKIRHKDDNPGLRGLYCYFLLRIQGLPKEFADL